MVWTDYIMSWILVLNFLLVCLLFISNFEHFSSKFRKVKKSTWLVFLIILIIGTGVRIMFPSCLTPDGLCWNYAGSASVFLEEGKFFDLESYTNGYPLLITFS
ncbi:MAG: hypothetical protein KAS04_04870, partial [Candidatus Aenigmarchaeota archaeon]|nr:hypothetical protein [Candidatus Aenigmarchaeota archaeon]